MKQMRKRVALMGMTAILGTTLFFTGCGKKSETNQETETVKVTHETSVAAEEIEADPAVKTKSANGYIQLSLPDHTWKSIEEKEDSYVYNSEGKGTIQVVRRTDLNGIVLPDSKDHVLSYLESVGDDISKMEVVEFKMNDIGTNHLKTVKFTVKNELEGMHPYLTSYVIIHSDELYDATALADTEDETILAAMKRSVATVQILKEDHPASQVVPETEPVKKASNTKETAAQSLEAPEKTGETMTLYDSFGNEIKIYAMSDGTWVDENGREYTAEGAGQWTDNNGGSYSTDKPESSDTTLNLVDGDGGLVEIHQTEDGRWVDAAGYEYMNEGAGQWVDSEGLHYTVQED